VYEDPAAFLSTLCISAPYVDTMQPDTSPNRQGDSASTLAVRQEVMGLINRNLRQTARKADDLTIVAVVQLLTGEMMSLTCESLAVHEHGLTAMIMERGGLEQLGGNGRVASTCTM